MPNLLHLILNLNQTLNQFVNVVGDWTYLLIFLIVFIETGLVVIPFIPGDSLIFTAGAIAALNTNHLHVILIILVAWIAGVLGDTSNFIIGKKIGLPLLKTKGVSHLITQKNLQDAENFFEKYGKVAIIFARFIPVVRTLSPFIASISGYSYRKFIVLDMVALVLWTTIGTCTGYFLGNIPFVKAHFSLVIIGILFISALPAIIGGIKTFLGDKKTN